MSTSWAVVSPRTTFHYDNRRNEQDIWHQWLSCLILHFSLTLKRHHFSHWGVPPSWASALYSGCVAVKWMFEHFPSCAVFCVFFFLFYFSCFESFTFARTSVFQNWSSAGTTFNKDLRENPSDFLVEKTIICGGAKRIQKGINLLPKETTLCNSTCVAFEEFWRKDESGCKSCEGCKSRISISVGTCHIQFPPVWTYPYVSFSPKGLSDKPSSGTSKCQSKLEPWRFSLWMHISLWHFMDKNYKQAGSRSLIWKQ